MPLHRKLPPGFTLIEMLVVLVIVGLMLAMTVPLLSRSSNLGAATVQVQAALRAGRAAAIAQGRPIEFAGAGAGGFWLGGQYYALLEPDSAQSIRVTVPNGQRIVFFPAGGSTGGRIFVEDPAARREIAIDAVTGHASIER
jgi:prepilin-type N-terminal cleavage/methylation domain-containing protein